MLWKLCGASVCVVGRSTSLRSPRVANSKQRFCRVSFVWLTISTSTRLRMRKGSDLIYEPPTQQDVKAMDFDVCFSIDRVGKT